MPKMHPQLRPNTFNTQYHYAPEMPTEPTAFQWHSYTQAFARASLHFARASD